MQLTHYQNRFIAKKFPIHIICDNITQATNIGGLFRTADAFGVHKIIFCGENTTVGRKSNKAARATQKIIPHEINKNIVTEIAYYKNQGYQIVCLEITTHSKPISQHKFSFKKPIAIIVGDENFGISKNVLKQVDNVLHIEMYGQNSSMNVVQATSIALYEITKQFLE